MDYDSLLELVKQRRSIRQFKPDPVPDEYIDKIIEAARWAPSGFNSQPWDFVVVKKKELRDKIVQIAKEDFVKHVLESSGDVANLGEVDRLVVSTIKEAFGYQTAPVLIILFGDMRTRVALPVAAQNDDNLFRQLHISGLANTFLYMHLAAAALGLASQWATAVGIPTVQSRIKELLGIPEELVAYDMMAVGYRVREPKPKLLRDKEKMVHYDYCGKEDFRTNKEVNDFAERTKIWTAAMHKRDGG